MIRIMSIMIDVYLCFSTDAITVTNIINIDLVDSKSRQPNDKFL